MYELRKGTMMMLTPNKKDMEMYRKSGWSLIEKSSKKSNKRKQIKEEINTIVDEVLKEEIVEQ